MEYIEDLIHQFKSGDITLDEMWDKIDELLEFDHTIFPANYQSDHLQLILPIFSFRI